MDKQPNGAEGVRSMKKLSVVTTTFLVAAIVLAFAPAAMAGEKKAEHGKMMSVKGEVVSISKESVEVKAHDGKAFTIAINDKTKFGTEKSPMKLDDFKKGDHVKVGYSGEGNAMVALDICKGAHAESHAAAHKTVEKK
jgi:hypothetical protein